MVIVQRKIQQDGQHYFEAVGRFSNGALARLTGSCWFYPSQWDGVKELLARNGLKLTNRWVHVQRMLREEK